MYTYECPMHIIYVDLASCRYLNPRSTLIGHGHGHVHVQLGEAENAGRLQVPEIGFFLAKDSWRFGGGEWLHVINAL